MELNADRATEDIDMALIRHPTKNEYRAQYDLFQYTMRELNVGPESLNLAVSPFLHEFEGWESEYLLLRSGTVGRIFRPTLSLFIALKLNKALLRRWLSQPDFQKATKLFGSSPN